MLMTIRILIVDNDAVCTKHTVEMLKEAQRVQFSYETVLSATDGMVMLHRGKFDVVLLNCCLPDMDGVTFLDILKAEHFRIPVVVMIDRHNISMQNKFIEHGAAEYLEKGCYNADLLERTCIYAIGLQEKINAGDSGPGVGILISQLVDLTRDAVKAQTASASEIKELRQELNEGVESIKTNVAEHHKASLKIEKTALGIQNRLIQELQQIGKIRWFLTWAKDNPVAAIVIFLCLVVILGLGIVLVVTASPEQIKAAGDAAGKIPKLIP